MVFIGNNVLVYVGSVFCKFPHPFFNKAVDLAGRGRAVFSGVIHDKHFVFACIVDGDNLGCVVRVKNFNDFVRLCDDLEMLHCCLVMMKFFGLYSFYCWHGLPFLVHAVGRNPYLIIIYYTMRRGVSVNSFSVSCKN